MLTQSLTKEKEALSAQITLLETKLSTFPDGELHAVANGAYTKWFLKSSHGSNYIPTSNQEMISTYALKKFYCLKLNYLKQQLSSLNFYQDSISANPDTSSTLFCANSPYAKYLTPYYSKFSDIISQWLNSDYEHSNAHPEHLIYSTFSGQNVRSKSEVIIANALYVHKIPFRYECSLHLGEHLFFPDFTIMHPQTQAITYWEHFGMMDQESYCDSTFHKLKTYAYHDIYPSINLITTYETRKYPIDSNYVEELIHLWFLS